MKLGLAILFLATALLYASVGFGGGSTYTALLVLAGTDYRIIPIIALGCNIVVVAGGVYRFGREGFLQVKPLLPFLITSLPAAWVGGQLSLSETAFTVLLGTTLLVAGIYMLMARSGPEDLLGQSVARPIPAGLAAIIGAFLGGMAGLIGIGGGIFLAPLLYILRWGSARQIAAACSLFILVNSIAGLSGQVTKLGLTSSVIIWSQYWPLLIFVLIGGYIGSHLGATKLKPQYVRGLTGMLVIYVAIRLLSQLF